jgi:hypothetical protein
VAPVDINAYRLCGHILLGLGSFIYFNIMLHKHVPTVIYKRSGTYRSVFVHCEILFVVLYLKLYKGRICN